MAIALGQMVVVETEPLIWTAAGAEKGAVMPAEVEEEVAAVLRDGVGMNAKMTGRKVLAME